MLKTTEINKKDSYIKDPIYKEINFKDEEWILDLVFSKELIRLQNIFQLGLSFKVFPSATNSRFIHSIGAFKIAQDFAKRFFNQISDYEKKLFLSAALLHDIGHGPFSHVFEQISHIKHEMLTKKIILDSETEIFKILKKNNIKHQDLLDIYDGTTKYKWIARLISSNLDVDRIDYMLRDSYYLGTCYSTIDVNFLIERSYLINNDVYFSKRALNVIESFLLGRYYMHEDIYNNKNTFVFEWALISIFERLKDLKESFNNLKDQIYYFDLYEIFVNQKEKFNLKKFIQLNDLNLSAFIDSLRCLNDSVINSFLHYFFYHEGIDIIDYSPENLVEIDKKVKKFSINSKYLINSLKSKGKNIYYSGEKNSINIIEISDKTFQKFPFESFLQYKKVNEKKNQQIILINKILLN